MTPRVGSWRSFRPNFVLLDHQLPGTTGDEVCRKLLDERPPRPRGDQLGHENQAFALYAEFSNVVDQIPGRSARARSKSSVFNTWR